MRPQYTLLTPPVTEPVSYEQAADHLRVDSSSDMALVDALISVGRETADSLTGRVSGLSTWKLIAPTWASLCGGSDIVSQQYRIRETGELLNAATIFRTPLVSVASVQYYPQGGTRLTTISSTEYLVVTSAEPGIIQFTESLPTLSDRPDAIQITFTAGYASADLVPPGLRHIIKMIVGHFYETRTPVAFANASEIPYTLRFLIDQQKIRGWCA